MAGKKEMLEAVWQLAAPFAEQLGLELWDIRYVKEGADWYLRFFIDKEGGVSIDDCEAMSRALDEPLDIADPIPTSYIMEVSSPGLERELVRPEHFEKTLGQSVIVHLYRPIDNKKSFIGELVRYADGAVTIAEEQTGTEISFQKKEISSVLRNDFY